MGIPRQGDEHISYRELEDDYNWSIIFTGGNCTALYQKVNDYRYVMITNINGHMAPETWLEPVTIGFYRCIENYEEWEIWDDITLEEFIDIWHQ